MQELKARKNLLAGIVFITFALIFLYNAAVLPIGTAVRMGPGYLPLLLSLLLLALGLCLVVSGLRDKSSQIVGIGWRGLLVIVGAITFFGATIDWLGLIPSLAISVFLASKATSENSLAASAAMTGTIVLFCWAVFIKGLGLTMPLFGTLFVTGG